MGLGPFGTIERHSMAGVTRISRLGGRRLGIRCAGGVGLVPVRCLRGVLLAGIRAGGRLELRGRNIRIRRCFLHRFLGGWGTHGPPLLVLGP